MEKLRPLWKEMLRIYAAYRDICERHGLRFWAIGGTAIGAVRHKGFIPWDDDFDVLMPYPDYMRFVEYAERELPKGLQVVTGDNTGCLGMPHAKVIEPNKLIIDRVEKDLGYKLPGGIFIDVFPYVGVPKHRHYVLDRMRSLYWQLRERGVVKRENYGWKSRLGRIIGKMLLLMPGPRTVSDLLKVKHRLAERIPFDESDEVNLFSWVLYDYCDNGKKLTTPSYRREWFVSSRLVPFEDTTVPIANGTHEWLTAYFGDYMKLPPESKRVAKHAFELDDPWKYGIENMKGVSL